MLLTFQSRSSRVAAAPARSPSLPAPHQQAQPAASLLDLQRTHGNQYVQRLLSARAIEPELSISQPGDRFEREADRVADAVMRMPDPAARPATAVTGHPAAPTIQRMCTDCEEERRGL